MKFLISTFLIFTLLVTNIYSKTAEQWKSRSVYQIITDRFAKTDGDTSTCSDLNNYCGGTYKGILNNLEYIQGMGFDAIWISPIVANTPGGYHGYWTSNFYELNENFGTPEELHELIKACHDRDIWVMVDVVANHIGYVQPLENVSKVENNDYSKVVPFNDPSHYNPHKHCDSVPQGDQVGIETCWLCDLPDLDQNNPFVRDTLLNWIADFVKQYNIDALRIDTIPHVSREFWAEFSKASGVFTVGEVLSMDLPYLARYQQALDSILNYALYSTLRYAFMNDGSMNSIQYYYDIAYSTWKDVNVLGNFVNNHDNPRFLSSSNNTQNFKAALAFSICSVGIPMVYYGDEQAFKGGMDPMNREPLWTDMNAESEIYYYLRTLNTFRKQTKFYEYEQIQRHSDNNVYAFSRGDYFFAFTNSQEIQTRTITSHPYAEGTMLCNIFQKGDCVEVMNGAFDIVMTNGDVKILSPSYGSENSGERVWDDIKLAFGAKTAFNIQASRAF